ncbi:hypothetical protein [uncultured Endozoicomonas sp.]|uniref:hypothetical protein n=1 Tax=uncultured Endozoicomonas sp. TaxID=432652 RepID=UPI002621A066|nr:hypothetical protein [uncultured Endozoicomonas sp.]
MLLGGAVNALGNAGLYTVTTNAFGGQFSVGHLAKPMIEGFLTGATLTNLAVTYPKSIYYAYCLAESAVRIIPSEECGGYMIYSSRNTASTTPV